MNPKVEQIPSQPTSFFRRRAVQAAGAILALSAITACGSDREASPGPTASAANAASCSDLDVRKRVQSVAEDGKLVPEFGYQVTSHYMETGEATFAHSNIEWGDGEMDEHGSQTQFHPYEKPGTYTIEVDLNFNDGDGNPLGHAACAPVEVSVSKQDIADAKASANDAYNSGQHNYYPEG